MRKIISIIPARGGSKGIPRKNLRPLLGKPLVYYSIKDSLGSNFINRTFVTSDDKEILEVSEKIGAEVIKRPKKLSTDSAITEDAMIHVIETLKKEENYIPDLVILLQPTSPFRDSDDIDGAIKTLIHNGSDSLLSVVRSHSFIWKNTKTGPKPINYSYKDRQRRQDLEPEFIENGSIYVTKAEILSKDKNRLGGNISLFVMDDIKSHDIDNYEDFNIVEHLMKNHKA
jgi:N-acylneuraminate cytidylyltransferase